MDKIYKIYFDGERVTHKTENYSNAHDNMIDIIILRNGYTEVDWSLYIDDLEKVLTYSLGHIVAYTLNADMIDVLRENVRIELTKYYKQSIAKREKEIRESIKKLQKLFHLERR